MGPHERSPVTTLLEEVLERHRGDVDGDVASYIPELAVADPDRFAIALVTVDGARYEAGDSLDAFTIQSISKPFVFGAALEELGEEAVRARVGVEPTGDAFNSITLDPVRGTPSNPMVNAGAITCSGLVAERFPEDPTAHLLHVLSGYAGRDLVVDVDVSASESATGHRNRAIAHLLRGAEVLGVEPEAALSAYFDQCSVLVDCRDLAAMAATLANGGVNPLTGQRVASGATVRSVLSVMATCGMYDGAGEWLYEIGLPAKSGVAGGIIAVQPGQFGIAVFSPRLDRHGNSHRGVGVCEDLSTELELHVVQSGAHPPSPIRSAYTLADAGSKRVRGSVERSTLGQVGGTALAVEVQGELTFAAAEIVTRRLCDAGPSLEIAIVDLRRVSSVRRPAVELLRSLAARYDEHGTLMALSGAERHPEMFEPGPGSAVPPYVTFEELDAALEWAEDLVLRREGRRDGTVEGEGSDAELSEVIERVELHEHPVLAGLAAADLAAVVGLLEARNYEAGDAVFACGEPALEMLLLVQGRVSTLVPRSDGTSRRLASFGSGSLVGELALLGNEPRMVDVRADTDLECHALSIEAMSALSELRPEVRVVLLGNLLRIVSTLTDKLRDELALLAD